MSPPVDGEEVWRPAASLALIRYRASILATIRRFFAGREVLEVETPILSHTTVTDPNIDSFTSLYEGPGQSGVPELYLQTSPEYAMKRLLAAGSGAIYQVCKVFRQAEWGALHNPEFTMLEWYRPGFDCYQLMTEVEALMLNLNADTICFKETKYYSYSDIFQKYLGFDPIQVKCSTLVQCAKDNHLIVEGLNLDDRDAWLDVIFSHLIQPQMTIGCLIFITDYPISQAALAQASGTDDRFAQRFELFFNGVELANGYNELTDAAILLSRFERNQAQRLQLNKVPVAIDYRLLSALNDGFPQCAGVALGVDRVIMLLAKEKNIADVIAFPINRA